MKSILTIVVFRIGSGYFGMEISGIEEIVRKTDALAVSDACCPDMDGILNLHEKMIPILNLHEKLQIESRMEQDIFWFMIIHFNEKRMAFPVDHVERKFDVPAQYLCMIPSLLSNRNAQYFQRIVKIDDKIVPILDPGRLFSEMGIN